MSKITYQKETIVSLQEELEDLIVIHHEELGIYNDKISLNVMWENYFALEEMGNLHVLTAREEDKLVGYYICGVQPNLHYADVLFSVNDILFIHPDYRKGFTGIRLIKEAEKEMRKLGVKVMTIGFKTYAPFGRLLERLGWDFTEKVYTKYIGED